jgi:hypothetical protein
MNLGRLRGIGLTVRRIDYIAGVQLLSTCPPHAKHRVRLVKEIAPGVRLCQHSCKLSTCRKSVVPGRLSSEQDDRRAGTREGYFMNTLVAASMPMTLHAWVVQLASLPVLFWKAKSPPV